MARYKKKPVEIEAVQVTKELVRSWALEQAEKPKEVKQIDIWWDAGKIDEDVSTFGGTIATLEGNMTFMLGDWLIRGVEGELYPCKNSIFEKTYEPV